MVNRNNHHACRANANGSGACKQSMQRLQAIDFSMVDTILYLDAYPESSEALEHYHKLHEERNRLLANMASAGCPPVTAMDSHTRGAWNWVDGPWPWEPEAN